MTEKEVIAKLKKLVKENYSPYKCGWTVSRPEGNYDDVFNDGTESGVSWAWYEVGCLLGMNLPEPEVEEDED